MGGLQGGKPIKRRRQTKAPDFANRVGPIFKSLVFRRVLDCLGVRPRPLRRARGQAVRPLHARGRPHSTAPLPAHQKTRGEERADRIAALAERLGLPRAALKGNPDLAEVTAPVTLALARPEPPRVPFRDPDPFEELAYPNVIRAKLAIADLLGRPLARLSDEERAWINGVLAETPGKTAVMTRIRERFLAPPRTTAAAAGHVATAEEGGVPC